MRGLIYLHTARIDGWKSFISFSKVPKSVSWFHPNDELEKSNRAGENLTSPSSEPRPSSSGIIIARFCIWLLIKSQPELQDSKILDLLSAWIPNDSLGVLSVCYNIVTRLSFMVFHQRRRLRIINKLLTRQEKSKTRKSFRNGWVIIADDVFDCIRVNAIGSNDQIGLHRRPVR